MKTIEISNEILIPKVKEVIDRGATATLRVKGYSMRIYLDNGRDLVTLKAPQREALRPGDVVLAEYIPEHYVLHRIIKRTGNQLTLMGDGNVKGTESCTTDDVIGIVTHFYRKGRKTPESVEGWKWKTYSRIWLALTPIRRYILAIYRRLF
ncbi:MAG: S24/S26 family peptidase [Bacteroidaceae bacterium]|nr:S24/S26 family peptidase [Bacteroidaceae bacterium]